MKGRLNAALVGAYVLLIALLMLGNCHGWDNSATGAQPASDRTAEEAAEQIGNDGDIKITLLWDFPGDVDLHVTQPNGVELWYQNMRDNSTGGELDVDNRRGGRGSAENIYWRNPPAGRYNVDVVMYSINSAAPQGGPVKVVIKVNDRVQTYDVRLSYERQRVNVKSFSYPAQ